MYRFAVIDDDLKDREDIVNCIMREDSLKECIAYAAASRFLQEKQEYDAVFLDIDMPEVNGITFARRIKEVMPNILIVFVSWHEDLIFEGMKLLPFTFVRKDHLQVDMRDCLENVVNELTKRKQTWTLHLEHTDKRLFIRDILYFEQMENYCIVYLISGKSIEFRSSMLKLVNELKDFSMFFQISRSYLVNLQQAVSCRNKKIIMSNHQEFEISRRRWTACHEAWQQYQMETVC